MFGIVKNMQTNVRSHQIILFIIVACFLAYVAWFTFGGNKDLPKGTFFKHIPDPVNRDIYISVKPNTLDLITITNKDPNTFTIQKDLVPSLTTLKLNDEKPVYRLNVNAQGEQTNTFLAMIDTDTIDYDLELKSNGITSGGMTLKLKRISSEPMTKGKIISHTILTK